MPDNIPSAQESACHWLRVVLDVPLDACFDYRSEVPVAPGMRVIVPFGRRKLVGMVVGSSATPDFDTERIKAIEQVLDDLPPLAPDWLRLARFAAQYYHRSLGEVMLPVLPASLRKVGAYQGKRSAGGPVARYDRRQLKQQRNAEKLPVQEAVAAVLPAPVLEPNAAQAAAVSAISQARGFVPFLLYGITGSGKTEVYLQVVQDCLARGRQVLFLTPEINLTPQLEQSLRARLGTGDDGDRLAVLHSGLNETQRLAAWLRVYRGQAGVLLGTRLAIFAPMPDIGLIIIDEEHDTSYKQQEGLRYSARDLAVWRARDRDIPVVLGSATPSLESWRHAGQGHYHLLSLLQRAREVELPDVVLLDTRRQPLQQGFSPQLLKAIGERLDKGEQSLVFINRRGYAPVLHCDSCGWLTQCIRCSAYTVLHRSRQRHYLQCHHCGYQAPVPRSCPDCGDQDLKPMGRGTQRVEAFLKESYPEARIIRIDADSTRLKGSAEELFAQVHAGNVDILVGTQMVAKGHDFANLGLVGVLNADSMLFAQDFRAPERLFAQLMQVAGRAGRHTRAAKVMVQTDYPDQPVYQALVRHDYKGFADYALAEREAVGLPPYAYQALLTAQARELQQALEFLQMASALPEQAGAMYPGADAVMLYDPVPLRIVRVANIERAQLLVESQSRPALQAFLSVWTRELPELAARQRVKYQLEVDPMEI